MLFMALMCVDCVVLCSTNTCTESSSFVIQFS